MNDTICNNTIPQVDLVYNPPVGLEPRDFPVNPENNQPISDNCCSFYEADNYDEFLGIENIKNICLVKQQNECQGCFFQTAQD